MKKIISLSVMLVLSQFAMADGSAGTGLKNHFEVGTDFGQVRAKSVDYDAFSYGVQLKDTLSIDNHGVYVKGKARQSLKSKHAVSNIELGDAKVRTYDVGTGYQYEMPINYQLTVTPHAGVGYSNDKFTSETLQPEEVRRTYAEIGVEAKYDLNDSWFLAPAATYQRDLEVKQRVAGKYQNDPEWGHKYDVEVGVGKKINNSNLVVAPYYSEYKNKNIDADNRLQDAGVRVKYDF